MIRLVPLATVLLALAAGCSTSPPEDLPPPQPLTGDADEPAWVTRPWSVSEEGITGSVLYAVGYAQDNPDLSTQLELARSRARNELSRIVGTLVTSITRDVRKTHQDFGTTAGATTDQLAVIQSEQITQELLQGSRQVDGWRDGNDGYWALVKLPLVDALAAYRQSLLGQLQREGTPAETIQRITSSTDQVLQGLLDRDADAVSAYIRGPINSGKPPKP
jgi:hypothetical protein